MPGCGLDDAELDVLDHWCKHLDGRKEFHQKSRTFRWRADCPVCHADRSLWFWPTGRYVSWRTYCDKCDKENVLARLAALLPGCVSPKPPGRRKADPAELISLALADIPAASLRLGLLELAGLPVSEALDRLGIDPKHKSRTVMPLRKAGR